MKKNGLIEDIVEKPVEPKSNIRGCGIYIFDPLVFEFIEKTPISQMRMEKEITETVRLMAQQQSAYGVLLKGVNINVNTLKDFKLAIDARKRQIFMKEGEAT